MGQARNSGRGANLDQKKSRAAGRIRGNTGRTSGGKLVRGTPDAPPEVGGAFGKRGMPAAPRASNLSKGAGGGGAAESAIRKTTAANTGRLKRRGGARKTK